MTCHLIMDPFRTFRHPISAQHNSSLPQLHLASGSTIRFYNRLPYGFLFLSGLRLYYIRKFRLRLDLTCRLQ